MKIESISIQHFKLFDGITVSFKNKTLDEISDRFLVLGDNGTGKTTLLQAIALPLAIATRQVHAPSEFDWVGFVAGRYFRWGRPRIELTVSFTSEEIEATQQAAARWYETQTENFRADRSFVEPGQSHVVRLVLDGEQCRAETFPEYLQFQGRYYARQLLRTDPSARKLFLKLPAIFWFDQFRNLGSNPQDIADEDSRERSGRVSYEFGVDRLRKYLNAWTLGQQSKTYTIDYLSQLRNLYRSVFPTRSFAGVEAMPGIEAPTPNDFYFLLEDGRRTYDIVEMSAGEQAVFPILYEFVRQQIAYSVVLIDEIDLNLHPPVAQLLVNQLPKIGPSCQFILTTHSNAVSDMIGQGETFRLPGGSLCL